MPWRGLPRPTKFQDTRTRRALSRAGQTLVGGITIGDPVIGGVVEELLYIDDSSNLASTGNARYKNGWIFHKNNGQPVLADLAEEEFVFSFKSV